MLFQSEIPRLKELGEDFIFQQNYAPTHHFNRVKKYLDRKLSDRWVGTDEPIM